MNFDLELLKELAIPFGVLITWFTKDRILNVLNIKKEENVTQGGNLENVQKALDLWQEMLDDAVRRHKAQVLELETITLKLKADCVALEEISASKDIMILQQSVIIEEQKALIEKQAAKILELKRRYESTN